MTRKMALRCVLGALLVMLAIAPASAQSQLTFEYTGAPQTVTVPSGATHAVVELYGAQGTDDARGGKTVATISVVPGQVLQINVGGRGNGRLGGWNGGANGGLLDNNTWGGGGGGASDVRVAPYSLTDRLAVAGGGGGSSLLGDGGNGGGVTGGAGQGLGAGNGGTADAGGAGGTIAAAQASSGTSGVGGEGGCYTYAAVTYCGGGGGGGWFGGGGGLAGGAGGGSGYGPQGSTFEAGTRDGDGLVLMAFQFAPTGNSGCQGVCPAGTGDGTSGSAARQGSTSGGGGTANLPNTGQTEETTALLSLALLLIVLGAHLQLRATPMVASAEGLSERRSRMR